MSVASQTQLVHVDSDGSTLWDAIRDFWVANFLVRSLRFRREVDVRRWRWMIAFALVASACGGSDSSGDTVTPVEPDSAAAGASPEGGSVTSSDGMVTVEVPAGAAPDGITVTVDVGDSGSLPQQLLDSGLPVFVYELGPDGTQFAEPVTVTFRIPAALAGFDRAVGMPLAVLASRSGDELLNVYTSVNVSLDGDVLVVSGSTDHFTQAVVILSGVSLSLVTLPSPVKVGEGKIFHALVSNTSEYQKAVEASYESDLVRDRGVRVLYRSKVPITTLRTIDDIVGEFRCDDETGGVLPDAITGELQETFRRSADAHMKGDVGLTSMEVWLGGLNIFGSTAGSKLVATFHADVECTELSAAASSTTLSTLPPGDDPEGDGKNGESEKVSEDEDVPGADIKSVRHVRDASGNHCFFIEVYGDGKKTATDPEEAVGDYLIDVEIRGANGWGTRVQFKRGAAESGKVRIGEKTSGRDTLEGAEATVEWTDDHTMKVTVVGTGTGFDVGEFDVEINVFWAGGSFYDHAEGIGQS